MSIPALAVRVHFMNVSVPTTDLPEGFKSIFLSPRDSFTKGVLETLATESGAPILPDVDIPLADRPAHAVEKLWKASFLWSTWDAGEH